MQKKLADYFRTMVENRAILQVQRRHMQQGLSENTKSGGEAGPAHSQQQEDGEGAP